MADFFDEGPFFILGKSWLNMYFSFSWQKEKYQKKGQGRKNRSFPAHSQSTSDLRSRSTAGVGSLFKGGLGVWCSSCVQHHIQMSLHTPLLLKGGSECNERGGCILEFDSRA
jgi:hypothetical protein